MELIADEQVKVIYNEESGILYITMPVYNSTIMHKFEEPFTFLIDRISHLKITRLLLNTSQIISRPSACDYKNILGFFYSGLEQSGLKKMARIQRDNPDYENTYGKLNQELRQEMGLSFEFRNFNSQEEAENWLIKQGADHLELQVSAKNHTAIDFWTTQGFTVSTNHMIKSLK